MALSASPNGTVSGAPTFVAIQTITLASTQASFNFTSIPQTYSVLELRGQVRGTDSARTLELLYQVNGQTGNYYDGTYIRGVDNGPPTSLRSTKYINPTYAGPVGTMVGAGAQAGFFSSHMLTWVDYSNTATYKTMIADNSANSGIVSTVASGTADLVTNMYFATNAISSILLFPAAGQFATGSSFTLYGLLGA